MELLKDYDIAILYHPGKADVVVDALSRKSASMGSLAHLISSERPLAREALDEMWGDRGKNWSKVKLTAQNGPLQQWSNHGIILFLGSFFKAKHWVGGEKSTNEYDRGVKYFLDKACGRASQGNEILCPCKRCFNRYWHTRTVVENHLFGYGFVNGYTKWVFHGEGFSSTDMPHPTNDDETSDMHDDIDGLLYDTFRNVEGDLLHEGVREGPSEDAKRFFKLVEEGKQELYPGCKNVSKLSFTIRLYLFKCIHGLSNVAFSDLLDLMKEAFSFAQLPESFNKAKKVIKDLGLGYEKIHACPNDYMLFWNDNAKIDNCSVCGSSRWKNVRDDLTNKNTKIPAKVLRYFPLKPRLQRIFMCSETSVAMRWHATERPKDGNLRHPADGEA
ncbi:uncharacterized protein LOC132607651 [Lycium barbarum]|uniref:uncharacterized protein LOC132607651 n=1 Tax=Lycium barbarum TaxID=112863 RepID=UPI00293F60CC|nr:uncharacterized protein LOC132607651 [Lycium barbarum]